MAVPTQPLPALGLNNATEDAKVRAVLLELQQILNAGIDATNLSAALAAVAPIAVVSALPGAPVDGQEIFYLADATNGIVWHLKYRAASASASKWEFVGGAPLYAVQDAQSIGAGTPVNTWTSTATALNLTAPLAGDYIAEYDGSNYTNVAVGTALAVGFRIGAADPALSEAADWQQANGGFTRVAHRRRINIPVATNVVEWRIQCNVAAANLYRESARLTLLPIRVG